MQSVQTDMSAFFEKGWVRFPFDPRVKDWVEAALPAARATVSDPDQAEWLRCGGTWFVGVNALPNDGNGSVQGGPDLPGEAMKFVRSRLSLPDVSLDRGQVSICYPGYPQPSDNESDAAYRFRRNRDAAHLDGLRPQGPNRRRHLLEQHGFVLGIPMVEADAGAAPLVVWEGSHELVREAFAEIFSGIPPCDWPGIDVTEPYQIARRKVFETCKRVRVAAKPGETYLVHRLAIHGVAPWENGAAAGSDGRMIVYFRPEIGAPGDWLTAA